MNSKNISDLIVPLGRAGIVFPVGLSLLFFFNGEFDGSQTLALHAILIWLMVSEIQGTVLLNNGATRKEEKVNLRMILGMMAILGAAIFFGLSLLYFFNGEFEKAQTLALYAILVWLMISEKKGTV